MTQSIKQTGFTLVELLIVVVLIGIIVAIAVPNVIAHRKAVNEANVPLRLKQVGAAQTFFYDSLGKRRYAAVCQELKTLRGSRGLVLSDATAQFSGDCGEPIAVNDWVVYDNIGSGSVNTAPLASSFEVYAKRAGDETAPVYCMFEDFLPRRGTAAGCTRTSPKVNN